MILWQFYPITKEIQFKVVNTIITFFFFALFQLCGESQLTSSGSFQNVKGKGAGFWETLCFQLEASIEILPSGPECYNTAMSKVIEMPEKTVD